MEGVVIDLGRMGAQAAKLAALGEHTGAVSLWEEINRHERNNPAVMTGLGAALLGAGRLEEAAYWLAWCCRQHPTHKDLVQLYGRALMQQKKRPEALGAFFHCLSLDPESAATHADLANALYWERQSVAALPYARAACRAEMSISNLSTYLCILVDVGQCEAALDLIDHQIAADPDNRPALTLLRTAALQALGRWEEGLAEAREAARLDPANLTAQHHYAASLLLNGALTAEAWQLYEARQALLEKKSWPAPHLRWTTQDVNGLTVLVHAEQGLGDTLQFVRYVPLLAARGARVVLAVQPSLVRLLQGTPGAAEVIPAGQLPPFDLYCPLLSLPGQFGTTLETIPPPLPYVLPASARLPAGGCLRIGLVWAGRDAFVDDRKRSLDPAMLAPLATVPAVTFHSLQFGATSMPFSGMLDAISGVADFADTAGRVAALDMVITVDTSVAHLAAAMGKPVWLLARHNGCWRWLLDREDSPWYPTVRLFRQGPGEEWDEVVARLRQALVQLVSERIPLTAEAA